MAIENINTDVWNGHRYGEVKQLLLTTLRGLISKLEGYDAVAGKANSALQPGDIVNGFDSDATDKMLSAAAGKLLKGLLDGKAPLDEYTGRLAYNKAPQVVLASMGDGFDDVDIADVINVEHRVNFVYYDGLDIQYVDANGDINPVGRPQKSLIYCNESTDKLYRYLGSGNGWQEVSSEGDIDLSGKADLLAGMLTPSQWPHVVLYNVNQQTFDDNDSSFGEGTIAFRVADEKLLLLGRMAKDGEDSFEGFIYTDLGRPVESTVYYCSGDKRFYTWNASLLQFEDAENTSDLFADETGKLPYNKLPYIMLDGLDGPPSMSVNAGLSYFDPDDNLIHVFYNGRRLIPGAPPSVQEKTYEPIGGVIYGDKSSNTLYRWNGSEMVPLGKNIKRVVYTENTVSGGVNTMKFIYTDGTESETFRIHNGSGNVGPNPEQQATLTSVEVTEIGGGSIQDAVAKASVAGNEDVCFQWVWMGVDSDNTPFKKIIWHIGNSVFMDAFGAVVYEPEEE